MRNGLCAVEHQLQRTTTALKHNIKVLQGDSSTLNLHEDSNQVAGLVSSIKQLQNELQMSITEILKLAAEWLGTSQQIQYDGEETETEDETELEDKVKVLADDTHLEVKQEGEVLRNPHNNATAETSKKRPRTSLNNHDIPEAKRTTSRISTADVDAIVARYTDSVFTVEAVLNCNNTRSTLPEYVAHLKTTTTEAMDAISDTCDVLNKRPCNKDTLNNFCRATSVMARIIGDTPKTLVESSWLERTVLGSRRLPTNQTTQILDRKSIAA